MTQAQLVKATVRVRATRVPPPDFRRWAFKTLRPAIDRSLRQWDARIVGASFRRKCGPAGDRLEIVAHVTRRGRPLESVATVAYDSMVASAMDGITDFIVACVERDVCRAIAERDRFVGEREELPCSD